MQATSRYGGRSRPRRLAVVAAAVSAVLLAAGSSGTTGPEPGPEPGPAPTIEQYVALGDSYTAAPLVPQVDIAEGCYRSTRNYPAQVARALGVELVDRSCSGARTRDMTAAQLPGVAPQLDSLTPQTDLVTVSIGGNDFSVFGTLVTHCPTLRAANPTGAPCRDQMRAPGGDRLLSAIARTRARVTEVVAAIRERSPRATVLVVGYPQIAPRSGRCPDLLPLADRDVDYAVQVNRRLTDALRHAARQNQVEYVDVWTASRGHDICSADPWINGQVTDPARAQSYHPFLAGQTAVARLVLDALG